MAKRPQIQSGVQQVAVQPTASPVRSFVPVRLDQRSIEGLVDLAPLSASVASVVQQLNKDYKIGRLEEGGNAVTAFAAENPGLVEQQLGGTDADRAQVRKRLREAVARGDIPEAANPILYELWDQVTMNQRVNDLETAIRLDMEAMTQVQVNGQRVEPKSYTQVRAEKIEELGITDTPGYSSVFGQRAFTAGMAAMDSRIQQEVRAAVVENTRRATRDGVRQGASQLFKDLGNKPVWGPEDYAAVKAYDQANRDGVANVKALMVEALLSQASNLGATDPEAAIQLLNNAGGLAFGPTSLEEDSGEFGNGQTYQEALGDAILRLEREADWKIFRETRERDLKWDEESFDAKRFIPARFLELQAEGLTIPQIREKLSSEILEQYGSTEDSNGPLLLEEMHSYLRGVEQRSEESNPATQRQIAQALIEGRPQDARLLLLESKDLSPEDQLAFHRQIQGAIEDIENLESDPAWRRAAGRLSDEFSTQAQLTNEQIQANELLQADQLNELQQGYLERRRENQEDPNAARVWLEAETGSLVQQNRQRRERNEQRAAQAELDVFEKARRFQDASSTIEELKANGLIGVERYKELQVANEKAQNAKAAKLASREFALVEQRWDDRIINSSASFQTIRELVGEDVIDPATGREVQHPNKTQLVNQVHDFVRQRYLEKLSEIHATAEPSQFPNLEAQARQEIAKEIDDVLGAGADTPEVNFREPTKLESAKAIVEAETFANSFAPGAEPTKPEQVSDAMFASYSSAVQSGEWKDFETHRAQAADEALSILPNVPRENRGQVAVDSMSLYGIPFTQVLEGEVELAREMPALQWRRESSGVRRGLVMRRNGITPDRVFTQTPMLLIDRTGSHSSYQGMKQSAEFLRQAKAHLGQWYADNPGKTAPAEIRLLNAQINNVESEIGRLRVPMGEATFNPFAVRMFNSESELNTLRKDAASWAALLGSKNFTTPIQPGSEEETAFIQAQRAAIRRARR